MMWKAFEKESIDIEADMQKMCPMNLVIGEKVHILEEKSEITLSLHVVY